MLEKGDKILVGDDIIITVMALGKRPQVHIDAPQEVNLRHIKADPDKQFLNRKRKD
jgi:sRNA-binding carbon storage regulator CsrA